MKRVVTAAIAAVLFVGSGGLTPPQPSPPNHAEWISSLAQPTQAARLARLRAMLDAHGLRYEVRPFTFKAEEGEGYNVIVTLGEGDRDILLTAHYDAIRLKDGTLADGAVDNAASVVALVKVADRLRGGLKNHRLRVIFFDQEELGLLGAKAYAASEDGRRVAAVFNFDINAYGDTPFYGENNGEASAFVLAHMRAHCAERAVNCVAFPVYPPSDDRVFSAAGVPVISIGSQDAIGTHQMWLAFNGGAQAGLAPGFVPPVFQRIHTPRRHHGVGRRRRHSPERRLRRRSGAAARSRRLIPRMVLTNPSPRRTSLVS
jgi:hypothetical protein